MRVLEQAVSPGEIADFEAHIPKDIAALLEREIWAATRRCRSR